MFLDFLCCSFGTLIVIQIPFFFPFFFFLQCGEPNNVGDLQKQPFYRFIRNTYILHPIALGALLYAMGGFPYIVWGMVSKPNMFSFCPKLPLMFVYICDTNTILVIYYKLIIHFAGCSNGVGVPYHLVCEFSLPCLGKTSLEYRRFVKKQLVSYFKQTPLMSFPIHPRMQEKNEILVFFFSPGGWLCLHSEKDGITITTLSNTLLDMDWNGGKLT